MLVFISCSILRLLIFILIRDQYDQLGVDGTCLLRRWRARRQVPGRRGRRARPPGSALRTRACATQTMHAINTSTHHKIIKYIPFDRV